MAKVSTNELKGRKFGRVLVKLGKVTREQVHEASGGSAPKQIRSQGRRDARRSRAHRGSRHLGRRSRARRASSRSRCGTGRSPTRPSRRFRRPPPSPIRSFRSSSIRSRTRSRSRSRPRTTSRRSMTCGTSSTSSGSKPVLASAEEIDELLQETIRGEGERLQRDLRGRRRLGDDRGPRRPRRFARPRHGHGGLRTTSDRASRPGDA